MADFEDQIFTGDVVRYLARFAPERLAALRRDHADPSALAVLQAEGVVMGGGDVVTLAAIEASDAMLALVGPDCGAALDLARKQLNRARYIELAGHVVGLASCGTLVALLASSVSSTGPNLKAITLAAVGFLSAAIPLVVSALRGTVIDPAGGLLKGYAALKDASWEAALLRPQLAALRDDPPRWPKDGVALVERANNTAKKAFDILVDLGFRPSAPR